MNHIHTIAAWVAVALIILTVWFGVGIAVALAHHLIKRAYQQNLRLCLTCRALHRPGATCDVLEAQLRHDLNAEAEAIYQGDMPHCPNCQVVFNNDADRSEVLPCADCQPDQLPQRSGKHRLGNTQSRGEHVVYADITDLPERLDDAPAHVIQARADKLRRQP